MKVSIFGLGYVGCVTAACLGKDGHEVIGVDVVESKVKQLASGRPTVVETGIEEALAQAHQQGRIRATTDGIEAVLGSEVSIICVGTPTGADGSHDLSALRQTARLIGQAMREKMERHVVVLRSTVPAGTTESLVYPALHPDCPPSRQFQDCDLVIVPEFLREGSAIADYYDPPFILVGSATGKPDGNRQVVESLFGVIRDRLHWVPFREAETLKAVCNAFHALKVAFANEVGALCATLSVDGHSLMEHFVRDRKLNIAPTYLRPGLPFGGSCLPKDVRMLTHLASRHALELPLLRSILASNEAHLKRAIEAVVRNGHRRVGLNGLAFKAGTDDLRESPIVLIAEHLIGKGFDLKIHDAAIRASLLNGTNREYIERHIPHLASRIVHSLDELIEHAEVLVITRDGHSLLQRVAALGKRPMIVDLQGSARAVRLHAAKQQPKTSSKVPAPEPNGATIRINGSFRAHGGNGKGKVLCKR
jgi:GDP-mannose 6-dehydrogenase